MWKPYMVEDRNLVTGQNPDSAAVLAKRMLEILAEPASSRRPGRRGSAAVSSRTNLST
jgi:hypothetical protein